MDKSFKNLRRKYLQKPQLNKNKNPLFLSQKLTVDICCGVNII